MTDTKETSKQILASIFFIAGIVLFVLFVFTIGKDKGFSQKKFQVEVLYRNVAGLVEGAPVRLYGVNVGSVAQINFLDKEIEGRKVGVTLNINSKFRKQLEKGTRFTIRTEGVLGEKLLEIYSIDNQNPVDLSKPIMGEDPLDLGDMAEQFADTAQYLMKTAEQLSQVDIVALTQVMEDSSRALLETSEGINDIMDELQDITKKSKRMFDRLEEKIIEGNLFKVF